MPPSDQRTVAESVPGAPPVDEPRDGADHDSPSAPEEPSAGSDAEPRSWAGWAREHLAESEALRYIGPLAGLGLFGLALYILHHEITSIRYRDVLSAFRSIPRLSVAVSAILTAASYLALTGYDALALRFVKRRLAYRRVALTSFISYVISHNLGLSFLGGSAIRFRMLSAWGLDANEIARVVTFNVITFWLGFLALGGALLTLDPPALPFAWSFPIGPARTAGLVMLGLLALYLAWSVPRRKPVSLAGFDLTPPSWRFTLAQIVLSAVDWAIAAAVFYYLLPAGGVSFPKLVGLFLLAQFVGVASNVPAGLGVFDASIVLLLSPDISSDTVIASVLAYRIIYYLVPLLAGVVLLGGFEALQRRHLLGPFRRFFGLFARIVPAVVPRVFAISTLVAGVVLLFSGATPAISRRMDWLAPFLPLPVIEMSHFLGSLIGVGLLLLARGLQQRVDAAYPLTVALLSAGIVASLLKGLDYEEALILGLMLVSFLPCRRFFYRRASLVAEPFSRGWLVAIALALVGTFFLLFWSYRHVEYSRDLWWEFALSGHASRSLRAGVGVLIILVVYAIARLIRPAPPAIAPATSDDLERARLVVRDARKAEAHLALLGDKSFLWSESGKSFVMYGVEGRSWVSMGDPVGPRREAEELTWSFRELADRHGGHAVFYQVGAELLPLYVDLGLTLRKLGEEARVALETFSIRGNEGKTLRGSRNRAHRLGCEFELVHEPEVVAVLDQLEQVSDAWLSEKRSREKGFSLGFFDRDYLASGPVALIRREGRITAFANVWQSGDHEELSVDLMRCLPDEPGGAMDLLFIELMLWGREHGYRWFNLGMAPLAGLEQHRFSPLWNRLGALLFRYGENFYNFRGLREFKNKFNPVWQPRFLASSGGAALPRILTDLASLISRGIGGVVSK